MHTILIDGKNALCRHGYVFKGLSTKDGVKTGALFGLLNCLLRLKKKYEDAEFVVVWDGKDATKNGWRRKVYPNYKSNRGNPNQDMIDVVSQMPLVRRVLRMIDIRQYAISGVEADDLISLLAFKLKESERNPVIYSSDKDFLQLIQYGIEVIPDIDKTHPLEPANARVIKEKFGCSPEQLLAVRAFAGDGSDTIATAIPKVGTKRGLALVCQGIDPACKTFDELPGLVKASFPHIREHWGAIRTNYRLMRLPQELHEAEMSLEQQLCYEAILAHLDAPVESTSCYKTMVAQFADLELSVAMERRKDIWGLAKHSS
jgi:DNA polymerase-1